MLGAGSWGTVLAHLLAGRGHGVRLWCRDPVRARSMATTRRNEVYLPALRLADGILVTEDLGDALEAAGIVILAVPSPGMAALADQVAASGGSHAVLVSAAKGFDPSTRRSMTTVLRQAWPDGPPIAALSGPNLAGEIADGQPAATVVACADHAAAERVQRTLNSTTLRVYTSTDVCGVELGGALKNVMALASGMLAELGYGANTQAAVLTRALFEIARLGTALGARPSTFRGLAGMGDMLATCSSPLSRNYRAGRMAARGLDPDTIRSAIGQAVEGLESARVARSLGSEHGIDMPLTEAVHKVLFQGRRAADAAIELMSRPPQKEHPEDEDEVA